MMHCVIGGAEPKSGYTPSCRPELPLISIHKQLSKVPSLSVHYDLGQ